MLTPNTQFFFSLFNRNAACWSSNVCSEFRSTSKNALCLISVAALGLGAAVYLTFRYKKLKNDRFFDPQVEEEKSIIADENQCCISELVRKEILESMGQQHPYTKANSDETDDIANLHNFNSKLSCSSSGGDTLKCDDDETDDSKIAESCRTLDSRMSSNFSTTFSSSNRKNHKFKKVILKSRTDDRAIILSREENGQNGFSGEDYQKSLIETLNALYGTNKLINDKEAKHLILILQQKNEETTLKVLTTICNLAAFTANQDLFRLNGALPLLVDLLDDCLLDSSVRLMLVQCLGNMAVNTKNNAFLQRAVAKIVESYTSSECSELQKIISIQTLTNLSVEILPKYVKDFAPAISTTLDRLITSTGPNLACLKFLINLSCCTNLASKILFSQAPYDFVEILNANSAEDVLIRSLTLLSHLLNTRENLNLSEDDFCEKNRSNQQQKTIFDLLFDDDRILRPEIKERLEKLKEKYSKNVNEEISEKIDRLLRVAKNLN